VTNAVVGEADGAVVLAELTPPLTGGNVEVVRLGRTENVLIDGQDLMKRVE
jgi:hypothetical protein